MQFHRKFIQIFKIVRYHILLFQEQNQAGCVVFQVFAVFLAQMFLEKFDSTVDFKNLRIHARSQGPFTLAKFCVNWKLSILKNSLFLKW